MAKKQLSALVLEDCEDDALLVVRELGQQGFDVTWERAWTATTMKSLLGAKAWDVVLSDYRMPGFDAPAALQLLQATGLDLPFIVISGTIGEEAAVAAMKNGAHDYLMKDNLNRLGTAIDRELRDAAVRREHRLAIDKIKHLNRVLRAFRNVNQLIVTEKDRKRLLERVTEMLVETRGYTSALCICMDDDQQPSIVAYSVATGIDTGSLRESIRANGLTACMKQALATNEVVVLESDAPECSSCPLASYYPNRRRLARGLVHDGKARGVLVIALPEEVSADTEELDLLEEMAADIAFALHGIEANLLHKEDLERFQIITESSPDAIFITDQTGNYTYVNRAACRLLGYSADELTKMTIADLSVKTQLEKTGQLFQELLAEGHIFAEIDLVRKDGTVVPVDLNSVILPDGEVYGSCRDLSERIQIETALRESEERWRSLLENAPSIIMTLDRNGTILFSNRVVAGLSNREVIGKNVSDYLLPEHLETTMDGLEEVFRAGESQTCEVSGLGPNGAMAHYSTRIGPVLRNGEVVSAIQIVTDITEHKQMQAQIRLQQKMESIGTLASGVAHEINNPIQIIQNCCELIRDTVPADGQVATNLTQVEEASERVAVIVKSLLSFARQDDQHFSAARIADIVRSTVMLIGKVLKKDQIVLAIDVPKDLPRIKCRSQQIQQVFMNLLTNARDALNSRYPGYDKNKTICICSRTIEKAGVLWIRTTVEDHGAGLPAELMDRVWEPFFTTKPRDKGTGLGLSVSHGIIAEHQGEMFIESEEGAFARFHLDLPVDNGWTKESSDQAR